MNALRDPAVAAVLARLHREAAADADKGFPVPLASASPAGPDPLIRMTDRFLSISPDEGRLLYTLACARGARRMVEFGASFGVSTLYLAAAARATGGHLITTEVVPEKCARTRASLKEAGLAGQVTILEGDALQTLGDEKGPLQLVFLDGWKSLYLPLIRMLEPALAPGALVVADNIDHSGTAPYAEYVRSGTSGYVSSTISATEISFFTAGMVADAELAIVANCLRGRRTSALFEDRPVDPRLIHDAIDAARWAPNHHLTEPWHFYRLGATARAAMLELLKDIVTEKKSAEVAANKTRRAAAVPAWLVVTCAASDSRLQQREDYAACACAIQNLSLYLWQAGVGMKWSTGPITRDPRFYALLGIDAGHETIVALISIGHPRVITRQNRVKQVADILTELD